MLNKWGEGSHADRLERIIARSHQANRLERQLALECEKRQALELRLKRLEQAQNKPAAERETEAKDKPVIAVAAPTGFDWRDACNTELNGDRRNAAYVEKLRRSVEAIQEYNAGRNLDDQYGINTSILRSLAGVSPKLIRPWMDMSIKLS